MYIGYEIPEKSFPFAGSGMFILTQQHLYEVLLLT